MMSDRSSPNVRELTTLLALPEESGVDSAVVA